MSFRPIEQVSDTAFWVATFRADEGLRPDALFQDPLAARLVEGHGRTVAKAMPHSGIMAWMIPVRTYTIDNYLREALAQGVDMILNLGAGLDTRPYRMDLPADLLWIEADFPHVIDFKNQKLSGESPHCRMQRVAVDLSNSEARQKLLKEVSSQRQKILVLTEGVVPYLSEENTAALADDLARYPQFKFWVLDYFSVQFQKYYQYSFTKRKMARAPFRFFPTDWQGFFAQHGWTQVEMRYMAYEGLRVNRPRPMPWIFRLLSPLVPQSKRQEIDEMTGYALLQRSPL